MSNDRYCEWVTGDNYLTEGRGFDDILDALLTRKLRIRAEKLDVPLPQYPVYSKDDPDWDENEHWQRNQIHGGFTLTL